jgi:hypothetical protein
MSYFYHLCEIDLGLCIAQLSTLRKWDHIFAATTTTIIVFELVYFFKKISKIWECSIITVSFIFNFFMIYFIFEYVTIHYAIYLLVYGLALLGFLVCLGFKKLNKKEKRFDRKLKIALNRLTNKGIYILGIMFLGGSLILFVLPAIVGGLIYDVTHSLWHITSAIGVSMILISMKDFLLSWKKRRKKLHQREIFIQSI